MTAKAGIGKATPLKGRPLKRREVLTASARVYLSLTEREAFEAWWRAEGFKNESDAIFSCISPRIDEWLGRGEPRVRRSPDTVDSEEQGDGG